MAIVRPEIFFEKLKANMGAVQAKLLEQVSPCGYPVYSSLDVRDAGWKIAVVDVNLFPAGFNILTPTDRQMAARRMREFFAAKLMSAAPWRITVVPEAHTHNLGYLENLAGILGLLREAGCETKLLWPGDPLPGPWKVKTPSGFELEYLPPAQALENAQALLLNHDLSGGIPAAIRDVHLPTFPSTRLGWYRRRKSTHQEIIDSLLRRLERHFDFFDAWYFSARSERIQAVNFDSDESLKHVGERVALMLEQLREDYRLRGIEETPQVFVKNDAGTYGMGVVSVKSADEIVEANRKVRSKMRKGKEAVPISQIILQEAVPTALTYRDDNRIIAGEPVLYLVNGLVVGGFIRLHEELGENARFENLNQPGSKLEPLDCGKSGGRPFPKIRGQSPCALLGSQELYGFMARLHAIAAGLEECPA